MAVNHITFNQSNQHGSMLHFAVDNLEKGLEGLNDVIAVMVLMIDGDGSQASQFTYMTSKFGFSDDAASKAAFDELNSLASKLNVNTSVTNVNAALLQAFNKLR
jgi:aspartokinase-like uncharacterized kinase